jgi:glutamate racemase
MDVMVLACTHFPLLADEIATTFPAIAQVDGGPGIARRIAYLTGGQDWPVDAYAGIAIFTGPAPADLKSALAQFGLTDLQQL